MKNKGFFKQYPKTTITKVGEMGNKGRFTVRDAEVQFT